jgi:uncharacterized membrane protein
MIQRIQTVYLVLAALSVFAVFVVNIAQFSDAAGGSNLLGLYQLKKSNGELGAVLASLPAIALLSLAGAIQLFSIFVYRKRKQQMQFVRFSYVLLVASIVAIWYFVDQNYWSLNLSEPDLQYRAGFYLPFVSFAFAWLANRSIRNDEELVKSLDRIR